MKGKQLGKFLMSLVGLVAAVTLVFGLTGCASSDASAMTGVTSVIDVRTADEFSQGHLQGAINIDVEAGVFAEEVKKLAPEGKYLIYCHSGRRAGIAVDQMKTFGFSDVTNIGGINDAANITGLPIVK